MARTCPYCRLPWPAECICDDDQDDGRPAAFRMPFREPPAA